MLVITDIYGKSEPLVTVRGMARDRKINGDETISFTAFSNQTDKEAYQLIQAQSIVEFDGIEYIIKESNEKSVGMGSLKDVTAVRKFFEDMSRHFYDGAISGTKTIYQLLGIVTKDTGYTFTVVDAFTSELFENFGEDNYLALFQTILDRYNAEFEVIGRRIFIRKQIGIDSDFQFRFGYNIKSASVKQSSYGLTTYIRGFGQPVKDAQGNETGAYVVTSEYQSPVADIPGIGIIEAEPIYDERVTDKDTLDRMLKDAVQDNPVETIELDFVDLRAAGYPYDVPGMGDRVFVIYEPLSNLNVETRITEVSEEWDGKIIPSKPIKTKVTLASINKDITDTLASFSGTSKTVNKVINKDGSLTNDVLPQAVKDATTAVESAQTEVLFDRGIRLIDPNNPLLRVVLTSGGIGVSFDGGVTYQTAMTGAGIVASAITSGELNTNNVRIEGDTNFYWDGEFLIAQDPVDANKFVRFSKDGLEVTTDGGATFKTAINADGVIADSIRSTGSIDIATVARVGNELVIGQDWQSTTVKRIRFNGLGGGAGISFNPASDEITIGALNGVLIEKAHFNSDTYRLGEETGMCGVAGVDAVGTVGAVAGTWISFKHKRYAAPSSITLSATSSNGTPSVVDISDEGFWLSLNGNGTAGTYRYFRGTYTTVD